MSDKDIFESPDQGTQDKQTLDTGTSLATLVGETRKYKTPEDLAKAYLHADEFLARLKEENAALRKQAEEAKTLQDVLDRLNADNRQNAPDRSGEQTGTQHGPSLSASDVAAIVEKTVTGLETQRTRTDNMRRANDEMVKLFGERAKEVFDKEASTPEMRQALMSLAAVSPEKFVAMFHKPSAGGTQMDSRQSLNTAAMDQTSAGGRGADPECKEFYDALRRKDPKTYYAHQTQLRMTRMAEANPSKFFGRS